jgi:hypothetical protein
MVGGNLFGYVSLQWVHLHQYRGVRTVLHN